MTNSVDHFQSSTWQGLIAFFYMYGGLSFDGSDRIPVTPHSPATLLASSRTSAPSSSGPTTRQWLP